MENVGLLEKIRRLPPDKVRELEDFVDLLDERSGQNGSDKTSVLESRGISREDAAEQRAALSTFAEDWELPEMNVYDEV